MSDTTKRLRPGADSHAGRILAALEAGNRLTPLDALDVFGCFRLGARIYDLRAMGWPVNRRMILLETGKRVAEYWL